MLLFLCASEKQLPQLPLVNTVMKKRISESRSTIEERVMFASLGLINVIIAISLLIDIN